jgi:hypothetical protein
VAVKIHGHHPLVVGVSVLGHLVASARQGAAGAEVPSVVAKRDRFPPGQREPARRPPSSIGGAGGGPGFTGRRLLVRIRSAVLGDCRASVSARSRCRARGRAARVTRTYPMPMFEGPSR